MIGFQTIGGLIGLHREIEEGMTLIEDGTITIIGIVLEGM
jgi:hypothetical protein